MRNRAFTFGFVLTSIAVSSIGFSKSISSEQGYAESIYRDYSQSTDMAIRFNLETIEEGALKQLKDNKLSDILTLPSHVIKGDQQGATIKNLKLSFNVDPERLQDYKADIKNFRHHGLPIEMGQFRKFLVTSQSDKSFNQHEALELCWTAIGHCVVYDPSIEFLDSYAKNYRVSKALGDKPEIRVVQSDLFKASSKDSTAAQARCGLASNPSIKEKTYTWGARTVTYKNIYGVTLVSKSLGAQQAGLRCDSNCRPKPFGYSYTSSGWGTAGYGVACDNARGYGESGTTGKWIAETKCTHKWINGTASASASVSNQGSASVSLSWTTIGSVDGRGGAVIESCGYF